MEHKMYFIPVIQTFGNKSFSYLDILLLLRLTAL